jgi:hypothetical protein
MKQNNWVAKHNPHRGGVHGKTTKAERKDVKDHLTQHALDEWEAAQEKEEEQYAEKD